jgi:hypothetical protein
LEIAHSQTDADADFELIFQTFNILHLLGAFSSRTPVRESSLATRQGNRDCLHRSNTFQTAPTRGAIEKMLLHITFYLYSVAHKYAAASF